MKSRLLFWISLGLNLVLLAAVCHFASRPSGSKAAPREVRITATNEPVAASLTETNAETVDSPGVEAFSWAQLASADFKVYRDRLRAIGCPEETVRDILIAEINEKFRSRREEIVASFQARFWEITAKGKKALEKWETSLKKVDEERQALIEEVLGKHPEDEEVTRERQTRRWENHYSWLPAEKQERLVHLELEFGKRNQTIWEEIRKRPDGEATAEDNQKVKALAAELAAARQQSLSPEEYQEYRLRNSSAGNWARNLEGIEVAETEWRSVAQLKLEHQEALEKAFPQTPEMDEAFARRYGLPVPDSAEAVRQTEVRQQMQAELDAAMKSALGPERFAEYQLARNSDYQQTRRIIERYQLSESLAKQAYEMQRAAAAHAEATRADANLSAEARAGALMAIRRETERALASTLGAKVFTTYQEYHGNWLNQLDQLPEE